MNKEHDSFLIISIAILLCVFRVKMKDSSLGKELFKNKIKLFKRDRCIIEIIIFIVCAFLYLQYMKSATGNDILTIIALCFALEANNFSVKIANYFYKKRK